MKMSCWRAGALATALFLVATLDGAGQAGAAERITSHDLARLADLQGLSVSPDGLLAAFQEIRADPEADDYDIVWKVVPTTGGKAHTVAIGGDPYQPAYLGRVNGFIWQPAPVWSPDGEWIAYLKKENGRTHIWRARVDGKRVEQITDGAGDAAALAWSKDGKRILYKTEQDADEIAAGLAEEGKNGFLYDQRFFPVYAPHPVLPKDIDFGAADGQSLSKEQKAARRVFVYDISRRKTRQADETEVAEFEALAVGPKIEGNEYIRGDVLAAPDGARAWTEARDPKQQGGMAPVTVMAEREGAPVVCQAEACTGQDMAILAWSNNSELLFMRREGIGFVERAIYAWKPGEASAREVLRTEDLFVDFDWKCAMGGARLICFYEESARPRRLVAIDSNSGDVETLYDPNPGFASFDLGPPPKRIDIRTKDGIETYGYLVLPPGYDQASDGALPLVVVTYRCGGFLRGGTGDEYPVHPFAASGFATLCINVPENDYERLKTMDWGAYQNWGRGDGNYMKLRVQAGLSAAVAQLVGRGVADPKKIAVTGLSFGAETTSFALFNMDLAAAIASGTEISPADTFLYGPAGRALLVQWGLDDLDSDRWHNLSITRNTDKVRGAFLLNVTDHELISALYPRQALEDAGRAVEMHVYPDEYHIKWRPVHRLSVYNRNIDWLNFWLRGVESGLAGDPQQYDRWRAMRENNCKLFGRDKSPPWYCQGERVKSELLQ